MARVWEDFLTEQDKAHLGIRERRPKKIWGMKPAVLNIDNYRSVAGDDGADLPERAGIGVLVRDRHRKLSCLLIALDAGLLDDSLPLRQLARHEPAELGRRNSHDSSQPRPSRCLRAGTSWWKACPVWPRR